MVFRAWGVTKSCHFGDIVYNLIGAGVMSKRDEDKREDFDGGWDLATAFDKEEDAGPARE